MAEEKAKREAQEKAKKLAEEKAKREAQEKAKKLAEEKAKREAQEKAKKLAEKKLNVKLKKKLNEKFVFLKSQKILSSNGCMKDIFNIGEAYIKNHSKINELNEIKVKLRLSKKAIEEYELKKEKYTKLHSEYISLLFKFYNEELKSGKIPNQNDFMNALKRYISIKRNI